MYSCCGAVATLCKSFLNATRFRMILLSQKVLKPPYVFIFRIFLWDIPISKICCSFFSESISFSALCHTLLHSLLVGMIRMTVHGTEVINLLYMSSNGIQFVFVKLILNSRIMKETTICFYT